MIYIFITIAALLFYHSNAFDHIALQKTLDSNQKRAFKKIFQELEALSNDEPPSQETITKFISITENCSWGKQIALNVAFTRCLAQATKPKGRNARFMNIAPRLIQEGADINHALEAPDFLAELFENKKTEPKDLNVRRKKRIANLPKLVKKSLMCCDQGALEKLLEAKIFAQEQLDDWLLLAADAGKYESIGLLLNYGSDPESTDNDGNTIFHLLAQTPYNKIIPQDILCPLIVNSEILNITNKAGQTARSLIDQSQTTNPKRYFLTLPLLYCLDERYTQHEYSLLQKVIQEFSPDYSLVIEQAVASILPFSNLRYKSKDKKTCLDLVDSETYLGKLVIRYAWKKYSGEIRLPLNTKFDVETKKNLLLSYIQS